VPNICDFVDKVSTPGSKVRNDWKAADGAPNEKDLRKAIAANFGLTGQDLKMCEKAIDADDGSAVEHHCSKPPGAWVK
jgi:hypothetical protein